MKDMEVLQTEILVVGGGTGGVAAAIQAARRGAQTVLVSEFGWLGGMLTSAGVVAPDGLELLAFQTGIWGAFLRELQQRQSSGLDHSWVSFFTYEPRIGAAIFADWVSALPNLRWLQAGCPLEVKLRGNSIAAVRFADCWVEAKLTIDATELGDVLALAEVPYRWGWEWQSQWQEPSAPIHPNTMTQTYSVQSPTWVVVLQDFGAEIAPEIKPPSNLRTIAQFAETWSGYGPESFLNYGRLPGNRFMINWPQAGNDYGLQADRLIASETAKQAFLQEALEHTQSYAYFLQQQLGRRYGLAQDIFPNQGLGGGAYALHPYYRESRRLKGVSTMYEQDILPLSGGQVAALPIDATGQMSAIAIGNYANDHHYPGFRFPLAPKSMRWGGRWTGTPFTLPYGCLIPESMDGLLVAEKNISVSHIANGATRLQPTVLGIGQAAGIAAALCIEQNCQPRALSVRRIQTALLQDRTAPMAIVPLLNVLPGDPHWFDWQHHYLKFPEQYPIDGNVPAALPSQPQFFACTPAKPAADQPAELAHSAEIFAGIFQRCSSQDYLLQVTKPESMTDQKLKLVTLHPAVDRQLQQCESGQALKLRGQWNRSGQWLLVAEIL